MEEARVVGFAGVAVLPVCLAPAFFLKKGIPESSGEIGGSSAAELDRYVCGRPAVLTPTVNVNAFAAKLFVAKAKRIRLIQQDVVVIVAAFVDARQYFVFVSSMIESMRYGDATRHRQCSGADCIESVVSRQRRAVRGYVS